MISRGDGRCRVSEVVLSVLRLATLPIGLSKIARIFRVGLGYDP
jgi:hypothetical protein